MPPWEQVVLVGPTVGAHKSLAGEPQVPPWEQVVLVGPTVDAQKSLVEELVVPLGRSLAWPPQGCRAEVWQLVAGLQWHLVAQGPLVAELAVGQVVQASVQAQPLAEHHLRQKN